MAGVTKPTPETRPTDKAYVEAAYRLFNIEGEIEIDPDAKTSRVDPDEEETGCYVQAWVWVNREEVDPNWTYPD